VSGRAELRADPDLLAQLSALGQPALFWPERQRVSFGRQIAPRLGGNAILAEQIDAGIEKSRTDH
jgi:hypothetical protein